jgi:membrane-associated phospholipid phosphatase
VVAVFLAGLALFGLIVVILAAAPLLRTVAARPARLETPGGRLPAAPPLAWVRHRLPRQLAWCGRRVDPRAPLGFGLTFTVSVGVLAAWAFGGISQYVVSHEQSVLLDTHVTAWVVAHRTGWLTGFMRVVTWAGSTAVIIPLGQIVGGWFVRRRHEWRPLILLAAAVAGAVALYDIIKSLVGRPRPPPAIWIGHFHGAAFPSGHATQSVAFYSMLAVVLGAGRSPRVKLALWSAAVLVALVVGASRIYLGAHWLTDVLGGYALGTLWTAVVVIAMLTASARGARGGRA